MSSCQYIYMFNLTNKNVGTIRGFRKLPVSRFQLYIEIQMVNLSNITKTAANVSNNNKFMRRQRPLHSGLSQQENRRPGNTADQCLRIIQRPGSLANDIPADP